MKSNSKTRKTDGRINNGGARKGAGRPIGRKHTTNKQFQRFMQGFLNDSYYDELIHDLASIDGQMRWILRPRFEYMVDEVLRFGMGLKKGHKKELNALKKVARMTRDSEKRMRRLAYIDSAIDDARDFLEIEKRKKIERWKSSFVRPDEGTIAYQIYLAREKKIRATPFHIDKKTGHKIEHEHYWVSKSGEGIEKIQRERERARRNGWTG